MDLEQKFVAIFYFYGFNSQDLFFDLFCFWPFFVYLKAYIILMVIFLCGCSEVLSEFDYSLANDSFYKNLIFVYTL